MDDTSDGKLNLQDLASAQHEVLQMFKRGAEFTEDLLKENERLRFRLAEVEVNKPALVVPAPAVALLSEMTVKVQQLEQERQRLASRFEAVERENRSFAERYARIDQENNSLIAIYVASQQLHSTLDFQEVLQIITEIILNFIGAEVFVVALIEEVSRTFVPLVAEGVPLDRLAHLDISAGPMAGVVKTGESYFSSESGAAPINPQNPIACVPLQIRGRVIGVIAIYKLLPQKIELATVDHELFTLLAGHAATAILAAKLYSESNRKLNTIQGFIGLVTSG